MVRSKFGRKLNRNLPYASANTKNYENFPAWTMSIEEQFKQLATNGIIAHQFYCDENEVIKRGIGIIKKYVRENPKKAVQIAVEARGKSFIRSINILTLAFAAAHDLNAFKSNFNVIIRTPRDIVQFIDIMRSTRGLGRGIKKAINDWLSWKLNTFYAIKYKTQLRDAIRLAHPKFEDEEKVALGDYIMDNPERLENCLKMHKQIDAFEAVKRMSPVTNEIEILQAMRNHRLDWNTIKGAIKPTPAIWKGFAENMSMIALVQNLASIERHAGADYAIHIVRNRVTIDNLQKGKVFPFKLVQAWFKVKSPDVKREIGKVIDSYSLKYDFSPLGKVTVAPDVSGSMNWGDGSFHNRYSHNPIQIAAIFSGILCGAMKDSTLLAWDTLVHTSDDLFPHLAEWKTPTKIMERIMNIGGGGTYMELPVKYMINHDIETDTFILITDSEEWGAGWLGDWKKYKRDHVNARAVLIRVDLYPTRPFSGDDCEQYDITQIYGFNDNVFRLLLER